MPAETQLSEIDRLARRSDIAYHVLIVVTSLIYLPVLGGIGSTTAASLAALWGLMADADAATIYWVAWGIGIITRSVGLFISGWLLGRYIRRFNPWYATFGLVVYMGIVIAFLLLEPILFSETGRVEFIRSIGGWSFYVTQLMVNGAAGLAAVALGTRCGIKSQKKADCNDTSVRMISPMYSMFKAGREVMHEVGVLSSVFPFATVFMVDGEEKLRSRTLRLREECSFIAGEADPHDIKILMSTFPRWSAQAFVDGKLAVEELFPDLKSLFKTMWMITAILVALTLAMLVLLLVVTMLAS